MRFVLTISSAKTHAWFARRKPCSWIKSTLYVGTVNKNTTVENGRRRVSQLCGALGGPFSTAHLLEYNVSALRCILEASFSSGLAPRTVAL